MKTTHSMRFLEADGTPGGTTPPSNDPPSLIGGTTPPPDGGTPPPPTEAPWINPDGAFSDKWTEKLPADLEGRESLGRFKSVADLAKSYRNLETMVGKKTLVPNEKSTPEEISAFRKALGVPDNLAEYDIKPEKLPEGLEWSEDNGKKFAEIGHKFNVPPAAMKALVAEYCNIKQAEMQAIAQEIESRKQSGVAELKKTWGADFDKNLAVAQSAAKMAGVNPDTFGFGDPEVVKAFVRLASQLSDDKLVPGGAGSVNISGVARAKDIQTNPDNPLHKKYADGDPDVVQMVRGYLQQG